MVEKKEDPFGLYEQGEPREEDPFGLYEQEAPREEDPFGLYEAEPERPGIDELLQSNRDVPFVKRIIDRKDYPVEKRGEDDATHEMADAEVDGRYYAYPTLRLVNGKLVRDANAITAVESGNAIEFGTPEEASEFARGSWKASRAWSGASADSEDPFGLYEPEPEPSPLTGPAVASAVGLVVPGAEAVYHAGKAAVGAYGQLSALDFGRGFDVGLRQPPPTQPTSEAVQKAAYAASLGRKLSDFDESMWEEDRPNWERLNIYDPAVMEQAISNVNSVAELHEMKRAAAIARGKGSTQLGRWSSEVAGQDTFWGIVDSVFSDPTPYTASSVAEQGGVTAEFNQMAKYLKGAIAHGIDDIGGVGVDSISAKLKERADHDAMMRTAQEQGQWYKDYRKKRKDEGFWGAVTDRPMDFIGGIGKNALQLAALPPMLSRWIYEVAEPRWSDEYGEGEGVEESRERFARGVSMLGGAVAHTGEEIWDWSVATITGDESYEGSAGAYFAENGMDLGAVFSILGSGARSIAASGLKKAENKLLAAIAHEEGYISQLTKGAAGLPTNDPTVLARLKTFEAAKKLALTAIDRMKASHAIADAIHMYSDPVEIMARTWKKTMPKSVLRQTLNKDTRLDEWVAHMADGDTISVLDAVREKNAELFNAMQEIHALEKAWKKPPGWSDEDFGIAIMDALSQQEGAFAGAVHIELPGGERLELIPDIEPPDPVTILQTGQASPGAMEAVKLQGAALEGAALRKMADDTDEIAKNISTIPAEELKSVVGSLEGIASEERTFLLYLIDEVDPLREHVSAGAKATALKTRNMVAVRGAVKQRKNAKTARATHLKAAIERMKKKAGNLSSADSATINGILVELNRISPDGVLARARSGVERTKEIGETIAELEARVASLPPSRKAEKGALTRVLNRDKELLGIDNKVRTLLQEQADDVAARNLAEGGLDLDSDYAKHYGIRAKVDKLPMTQTQRTALNDMLSRYEVARETLRDFNPERVWEPRAVRLAAEPDELIFIEIDKATGRPVLESPQPEWLDDIVNNKVDVVLEAWGTKRLSRASAMNLTKKQIQYIADNNPAILRDLLGDKPAPPKVTKEPPAPPKAKREYPESLSKTTYDRTTWSNLRKRTAGGKSVETSVTDPRTVHVKEHMELYEGTAHFRGKEKSVSLSSVAPDNVKNIHFVTVTGVKPLPVAKVAAKKAAGRATGRAPGGAAKVRKRAWVKEHRQAVISAAKNGEYVGPEVRASYAAAIEKEAPGYLTRMEARDRFSKKVNEFLANEGKASKGRTAANMLESLHSDITDAMRQLNERYNTMRMAPATRMEASIARDMIDDAIKTGGKGSRAKFAAVHEAGHRLRVTLPQHMAEAHAIRLIRHIESGGSPMVKGIESGALRKHLTEHLGLEIDIDKLTRAELDYLDWVADTFTPEVLEDVAAVYTVRPGHAIDETQIAQLNAVSRYSGGLKTFAIQSGAKAVREGLMSPEVFMLNIVDYFPDKYIQHEELFREIVGAGQTPSIADIYAHTGTLKMGEVAIGGEHFRKAKWRHRSEAWKREHGKITDPRVALLKGYTAIWHDIVAKRMFRRLSGATLTEGPHAGAKLAMEPLRNQKGRPLSTNHKQTKNKPDYVPDDWVQVPLVPTHGILGDTRGFGDLSGKWVPRDVFDEVSALQHVPRTAEKLYKTYVRFWKINKTALSIPTSAANWISNMVIASMKSLNPFNPVAGRAARKAFAGTWNEAWQKTGDWFQESMLGGLWGNDFISIETKAARSRQIPMTGPKLRDIGSMEELGFALADAVIRNGTFRQGSLARKVISPGAAIVNAMSLAYQFGDEFWKLWRYKQTRILQKEFKSTGKVTREMKRVFGDRTEALKVLDAPSEKAAVRQAVDSVHDSGFFDYSRISRVVGFARQTYQPFLTFTYNAIPFLSKYNRIHPIRSMVWRQLFEALNTTTAYLDGEVGMEDLRGDVKAIEDARSALPSWARETAVYAGKRPVETEPGHSVEADSFWDLARFTPASGLQRRVSSFGTDFVPDILEPNGLFWPVLGAVVFNRDPDSPDREMITEGMTHGEVAGRYFDMLRRSQLPPLLGRDLDKIVSYTNNEAYRGRTVFTMGGLLADLIFASRHYDVMDTMQLEKLTGSKMDEMKWPIDPDDWNDFKKSPSDWVSNKGIPRVQRVKDSYNQQDLARKVRTEKHLEKILGSKKSADRMLEFLRSSIDEVME